MVAIRSTKNNPVLIGEPGVGKTAIVAAAELSHRYATDRFLPDMAIDLIDEAAKLGSQQQSM